MLTLVRPRLPVRRISQAEVKRHGWCRRNVYAEPKGMRARKDAEPSSHASNDPFDHELRYLLSRGEMRRFLDAIAARTAIEIYDPERPISYTRTTYLDTDDLAYFRAGEGAPARRLRIREYAVAATAKDAPVLSGVAFVELKQHDGPARSKVRLAASPAEIAQPARSPRGWPLAHDDRGAGRDRPRAGAAHHGPAPRDLVPAPLPDGGRAPRPHHARRESDLLPAAADRRGGRPGGAARARGGRRVSGAGPGDQTLRRDAVLAGRGAGVAAAGGRASPSSGWG